jgi:hypothetical protein
VVDRHCKLYDGSHSIVAATSQETAAKIVIYERRVLDRINFLFHADEYGIGGTRYTPQLRRELRNQFLVAWRRPHVGTPCH